jgi:hypothetical protein
VSFFGSVVGVNCHGWGYFGQDQAARSQRVHQCAQAVPSLLGACDNAPDFGSVRVSNIHPGRVAGKVGDKRGGEPFLISGEKLV